MSFLLFSGISRFTGTKQDLAVMIPARWLLGRLPDGGGRDDGHGRPAHPSSAEAIGHRTDAPLDRGVPPRRIWCARRGSVSWASVHPSMVTHPDSNTLHCNDLVNLRQRTPDEVQMAARPLHPVRISKNAVDRARMPARPTPGVDARDRRHRRSYSALGLRGCPRHLRRAGRFREVLPSRSRGADLPSCRCRTKHVPRPPPAAVPFLKKP